ncbi:MAG: isoleucine--tRNA ligase [Planctomycetota bacterium]
MSESLFEPLATSRPPRETEEKILESWRRDKIFEESLRRTSGGKPFVFYEGPPTANGMPHTGHVLTRVMKDLWPRYKTMDGFSVARKAGWDTHGLPVEVEVEKVIGSKRKQDIEAYGIEKFVNACRESVWKYKGEWERMTERVGMWLDLEDPYITYAPEYIDSVWWALQQLSKKGLLKKGYKILPWCPVCQTGLSSHEVGQGYEEVKDPAITVAFKLKDRDEHVLAWTTTPWTLLSNIALVVGPDLEYGLYEAKDGRKYWLATGNAKNYAKELGDAAPAQTKKGTELVGLRYEPLFTFAKLEGDAHKVVAGDFVVVGDGSGVVHAAPAFGEDDYRVCKQNGLAFVQLVKPDGTFTADCGKYAGKWIKDADPEIIRELKERKLVFKHDQYLHDYPHCWRTKNPLIYYARSAWFIETTREKAEMVQLNKTIAWAPEHIRDGRFGQFLDDNRDWNVSRERYWATPLPIWVCSNDKCAETLAVGSRQELVDKGATGQDGKKITDPKTIDPHRPWVDYVKLPCPRCKGTMERDLSVIDCWFDSGAMPFAQWGYPHVAGSKEKFERNHPADFICEAIDQTRGWFYTLHAISTLLFDKPAYKRCVVLGHTLNAQTKKKESKSDKNYKPPAELFDTYGADAVRWYFYSKMTPGQPVVSPSGGEGVKDANRTFLHKILNVYNFFAEYAKGDGYDPRRTQPIDERTPLDHWIISERETTTQKVRAGLDDYDFHAAAVALEHFVDALSNWYLRRSRERAWSDDKSAGNTEKWGFYTTLHDSLGTLTKLLAPFTPFLADELHGRLLRSVGQGEKSVHLEAYPQVDESRIDRELERAMDLARRVSALGASARQDAKINNRKPLRKVVVLLASADDQAKLRTTAALAQDELNVKAVEISSDYDKYVQFDVLPVWKSIGKKLGKRFRGKEGQEVLNAALRKAGARAVAALVREGKPVTVDPGDGQGTVTLEASEVETRLQAKEGFTAQFDNDLVVVLDTTIDRELEL